MKNEYYKFNDGFFSYYVNRKTGEKKMDLNNCDIEVEHNIDDSMHVGLVEAERNVM